MNKPSDYNTISQVEVIETLSDFEEMMKDGGREVSEDVYLFISELLGVSEDTIWEWKEEE